MTPFELMQALRRLVAVSVLGVACLFPLVSFAQTPSGALGAFTSGLNTANSLPSSSTNAGAATPLLPTISLPVAVGNAINDLLSVSGIAIIIYIIYAGILYVRAGINPESAKKAKQIIVNGVIGFILVVAAYAITWAIQLGYAIWLGIKWRALRRRSTR